MFTVKNTILVSLGLLIFLPGIGCEKKYPTPPTVSTEALIDARAKYELQGLEIDPQQRKKSFDKEIEDSLAAAEKIADSNAKDNAYADIVKKSTFFQEYDKAVDVARLIKQSEVKDPLLEDIARIRLNDAASGFILSRQLAGSPAVNIQGALESARSMGDPFRRIKVLGNIEFQQMKMENVEGARQTILEAADALDKVSAVDPRKATVLCQLARWMLRIDEKTSAQSLCKQADQAATAIPSEAERVSVLKQIAELYLLLGDKNAAADACRQGLALTKTITDPKQQLKTVFDLTDISLDLPATQADADPAQMLKKIKEAVLKAAAKIPSNSENEPTADVNTSDDEKYEIQDGESLLKTQTPLLTWKKIIQDKNDTLAKIAKRQVWQGTLEDVWETLDEIDEPTIRDGVVVETIDMLIAIKSWDDAAGWSEEIADPTLKKEVRRKIVQQKKTAAE